MSKYLKKFETSAAYTAAESNLILPNVSYVVEGNDVHYNPYVDDPYNGHEYVDLGLPSGTKWATMNVGANSETDYGNYYMYGKGATQFIAFDSPYEGTENPLAASADTATVEWGGNWHMPTKTQLEELIANTIYAWVEDYQGSGVNGVTFTANGQTLFIPAAGYYEVWGDLNSVGDLGFVLSSTPMDGLGVFNMTLRSDYTFVENISREGGNSVRPVVG